jgi:acetyltransferase
MTKQDQTLIDTALVTTRAGIELSIRPAGSGDEERLSQFFDQVSDEDRRFRFFAAARHLSHDQLEPLIHADHLRSESFLVFDRASGELIASALLACDAAMDTGEIAVSVRNDYRGRGVGWAALEFLASQAEARGVRRVISIESRENHAAIELERENGFAPEPMDGDPTLVILSKIFPRD